MKKTALAIFVTASATGKVTVSGNGIELKNVCASDSNTVNFSVIQDF